MITDVHCHILPALDDGARDTDTALALLKMMGEQGITQVIATPHFYASDTNIERFLKKRNSAYEALKAAAAEKNMQIPEIKLGAEVYYFNGIGNSEGVKSLAIEGGRYILLELNHAPVTDSMIRDIYNLQNSLGLVPIFAHIERFAKEKSFKRLLELIENGMAYAQINAEAVLDFYYKRTALKLIRGGYISLVGTDTHSIAHRPPKMQEAFDEIKKRFGQEVYELFAENGNRLFDEEDLWIVKP